MAIDRTYEGRRTQTGDPRAVSLDVTQEAVDRDEQDDVTGRRRYLRLQTDRPRRVAVFVTDDQGQIVTVDGEELSGEFDLHPTGKDRLAVLEVVVRVKNNRAIPPVRTEEESL